MFADNTVVIQSHDGQNKQILSAIEWDTFQRVWAKNEQYQLLFTAYDDRSLAFNLLTSENSVFYDGQEYIIKQIVDEFNGGQHTMQITATHVYYQLSSRVQFNVRAGDNSFSLSEALGFLFDGVSGFSYEIHGGFNSSKTLTDFGNVPISEGISTIKDTFGVYAVIPDNHVVNIYDESSYVKETRNVLRYRNDTSDIQLQYDSQSIVNRVQAVSTAETPAFEPFFVENQESINTWGIREGVRVESDTVTDVNQMRTLAAQSFVLQPTIAFSITTEENRKVKPGELWNVQILETNFLTKVEVVSITETPFTSAAVQIELNNSRANYLDAQKAQAKIIKNIQDKQSNVDTINTWVIGYVEE
ncbi:prophage protein [Weissella oryzae SG25]|uniref:Prophage protein n=1 Tax=Weissella oryzae (strain DSM 25784 / JCM 18191 / LMG 30913 / SG25) TaxID=1329250 RepID=A0A069CS26_WEIOS|nr:prophage endopeptidase tail family protein [Weissella oryzae]GAK30224.1 prophage protein [Weissella oryzae SG25]